mmetsp:Transcript_40449/g.61704  ORF Transcript_40449/g.61704 Transcript_40449/m.61704 type:complete len:90 (+) Transcript_40449:810-1079(+)
MSLTRNTQSMVSIINERQRRLSRIQKVRDLNNNFLSHVVQHSIREEENEYSESEQPEKDLVLKIPSPLKSANLFKEPKHKVYPKSHVYH